MKNLFFYGTLAHRSLLEVVLGRGLDAEQVQDANLPEYAPYWVKGQAHPMLVAQKGAAAKGLYLTGLSALDVARLDFYEGGFDYDLRPLTIETATGSYDADVYFPTDVPPRGDPWVLDAWTAEWGDFTVQAATEVMGYFGQITAQQLGKRFPAIRRRAASFIRGQAGAGKPSIATPHSRADVAVSSARMAYSNFYAMQEFDIRYRKFNGEMGDQLERATFVGFDVVIVLPYDPVLDCVLLVEQFRLGPYARGVEYPWSIEPVAGHIDVGETPEMAAMRECKEETGLTLQDLLPISAAYPSPGASSEFYYCYLGLCDLAGVAGGISGLASESEDILSRILSFDVLMDFVDTRQATNQPLILAAYWLARNRGRLRRDA